VTQPDNEHLTASQVADVAGSMLGTPGPREYATPEYEAAWTAFHDDPVTKTAQQTFTEQEQRLQPMRDAVEGLRQLYDQLRARYNEHMTAARIQFQAEAHVPLFELTGKLRALDGTGDSTT
jgi:uncharacterized membrane protein YccC